MAVVDQYVDSRINTDGTLIIPGPLPPPTFHGAGVKGRFMTFETVIANDNDSIYRLFTVPADIIPVRLTLTGDGVAGLTDVNIGLYSPYKAGVAGAVISGKESCFIDAANFSAAKTWLLPVDGLADMAIESRGKLKIFEIAGHTIAGGDVKPLYDIAMKAIAAESAVGTISAFLEYMQG